MTSQLRLLRGELAEKIGRFSSVSMSDAAAFCARTDVPHGHRRASAAHQPAHHE
jgi:hypothetical protein